MAFILKLPEKIGYNNAQATYEELADQVRAHERVTLNLDGVRLDSITRAVLRKLVASYPEKVEVPARTRAKIDYSVESSDESGAPKTGILEQLGQGVVTSVTKMFHFMTIIVDMLFFSFQAIYDRKHIVRNELYKNIYAIGYRAIPVVALLSFLIGLTITLQAAIQMAQFGGQGYLALLIATAMFKELGPLITAIIIAGRTGSSIAAEIGTMVVMEEVDALQTMGVKPLKFLLVPKFWAFTISMPILTMLSSLAGILGGLAISIAYDVPAASFISQAVDVLKMSDLVFGVLKSFTFAWVILAIACYKGLMVRGGADAVGKATTDSVVLSIFMVVVIDALYSIFLYA